MATWSQIFRALALKLAKIQRWKEKGVIFQFSFKNPGIAKKALVKNIFFFILELTFCNYLSFSIEKSRVFLKKTWWQISSSVLSLSRRAHKSCKTCKPACSHRETSGATFWSELIKVTSAGGTLGPQRHIWCHILPFFGP